ncbi:hypothetical protein LLB_2966 [Legionella longbeachae D-4968]|nr:hypothetical protein LLB_2966 [Legionella longbeachae D-4968]
MQRIREIILLGHLMIQFLRLKNLQNTPAFQCVHLSILSIKIKPLSALWHYGVSK